jgi:glycosyltransferase involved in cell wall biosynthesis
MYLLTIAVPTYNRMAVLPELFNSFLQYQSRVDFTNEIQFLFVNNNSTDGTRSFLDANIKLLNTGKVINNTWNVGGDLNFIKCIEYSDSEYVWLFGDDDLFLPDRISSIVETIKSTKADIYIQNILFLKNDKIFNSIKDYVEFLNSKSEFTYLLKMTLITNNIFKKNRFNSDYAYLKLHTNYAHVYGLFNNIYSDKLNIYLCKDLNFEINDVRQPFEINPENLTKKHRDLLLYFSKLAQNLKLEKFAKRNYLYMRYFFIPMLSIYNIPIVRFIYRKIKYRAA